MPRRLRLEPRRLVCSECGKEFEQARRGRPALTCAACRPRRRRRLWAAADGIACPICKPVHLIPRAAKWSLYYYCAKTGWHVRHAPMGRLAIPTTARQDRAKETTNA